MYSEQQLNEAALENWLDLAQTLNGSSVSREQQRKEFEKFLASGNRSHTRDAFINGAKWATAQQAGEEIK